MKIYKNNKTKSYYIKGKNNDIYITNLARFLKTRKIDKFTFTKNSLHDETEIMRKFVNENKDKLFNFPDHSINEKRKKEYINLHKEENVRYIVDKLVNSITYIDIETFRSKIEQICNIYNKNKTDKDIYIIIIPNNTLHRSNFYISLISALYLKYDYIIDCNNIYKYEIEYANNASKHYIKQEHNIMHKFIIKNLLLLDSNNKNINLFLCDDCIYSGRQFNDYIKYIEKYPGDNINYSVSLIIPYILNKKILNDKIPNDEIKNIIINNVSKIKTTEDIISLNDVEEKIKKLKEKYKLKPRDFMDVIDMLSIFGHTHLVYFNFKLADEASANQIILSGKIINKLYNKTLLFDTDIINYNFINNCSSENVVCPDALYNSIKYTLDGNPIDVNKIYYLSKSGTIDKVHGMPKSSIKSYYIHDNGGRPFRVDIKKKNVYIYEQKDFYNDINVYDEYDEENNYEKDPVLTFKNVKNIFIGGEGDKIIDGFDAYENYSISKDDQGNSILLELGKGTYDSKDSAVRGTYDSKDSAVRGTYDSKDSAVRGTYDSKDSAVRGTYKYIGPAILSFIPIGKIVKYFSPIGNSDVPYPFAVDEFKNVYLFIIDIIIENYDFKNGDPYLYYWDDEKRGKKFKYTIDHNRN